MVTAPRMSRRAVDRIEYLLARGGPYCPVMARIVAENMRVLGLYSPEAHREHFAQLAAHFAAALHALRCAERSEKTGLRDELAQIIAERVELDESVTRLHDASAGGRGVIIMGPHIVSYLLSLARLNQEIPLTVYLRYSKDARRRAAKERWYRASGVSWISEPATHSGPLGRLGRMAAALSEGRTLFITPDLPQRRENGTPVQLCEREVYLPAGPALLAVRTGAPLFVLLAQASGRRQRLVLRGPFETSLEKRGRQARRAAVQRRLQWFADCFAGFLAEQTPLWYLWGDKRWTRVLRNDPRYVRLLADPHRPRTVGTPTDVAGVL